MLKLFGNTNIKAFGLDVSDVSIKVMQLHAKNRQLVPLGMADVPLTPNVIANHMIVNEAKLADNMKKAVAAARHINTNYVVASVPDSKSFVRVLKVPKMSDEEITGALPFELEQNIPVPIDLVYFDWQILRDLPDKFVEILVTATPKDYIDSLVATMKTAGLKPVALELESQALTRALVGKEERESAVLIADISGLQTTFVVVDHGTVYYTSSIPVAGNAFTESIARNVGISASEAEEAKRKQGLVSDIKKGNIRQAILPLLDNIIDEIKNVVKFHEEHSVNHSDITKIMLCGGSARLPGVADYISARLNLGTTRSMGQVIQANPWVNILDLEKSKLPISLEESLGYSTVAGLALRGASL